MLKQLFGDEAMSGTQTHSAKVLKRAKPQLRKINVQDKLQQKNGLIHKKILFGTHIWHAHSTRKLSSKLVKCDTVI